MKKIMLYIFLIIAVMIILPLLAKCAPADAGMALCFLLFYIINPLFSAGLGAAAGQNLRKIWYIPIVNGVVFILSAWMLFTIEEIAFLFYGVVYALIGVATMIIAHFYTIKWLIISKKP